MKQTLCYPLNELKVLIPCWLVGILAAMVAAPLITWLFAISRPWQFHVGLICGGAGVNLGSLAAYFILSRRDKKERLGSK